MQKQLFTIDMGYLRLIRFVLLIGMLKLKTASSQAPSITGLSPIAATVNSTVTLSGSNFNASTAGNTVWFGGVKAKVTAASSTSLTVTVPPGAGNPIRVYTSNGMAEAQKRFIFKNNNSASLSTSTFSSLTTAYDYSVKNSSPAYQGLNLHSFENLNYGDLDNDGYMEAIFGRIGLYVQLNTTTAPGVMSSGSQGAGSTWVGANFETRYFSTNVGQNVITEVGGYNSYLANEGDVTYADFDGDGKLDLVSCRYRPSNDYVAIARNNSTAGALSFSTSTISTGGRWARWLCLGDFDVDGKIDVVVSTWSGGGVVLRNQSTSGSISFAALQVLGILGPENLVQTADLDADGKTDLIYREWGTSTIKVRLNTSSGAGSFSFGAEQVMSVNTVNGGTGTFSIADMDGDSKLDLIVPTGDGISVLLNTSTTGSLSFAAYQNTYMGSGLAGHTSVGDLDGDGKNDVAFIPDDGYNCYVVRNVSSGVGSVSFNSYINLNPIANLRQYTKDLQIGDFDGDGDNDIGVLSRYTNSIQYFSNNTSISTLPVNFVEFTAQRIGSKVQLKWKTTAEQNNKGFYVERSTDGLNFVRLGFIKAREFASSAVYQFVDMHPSQGNNFYRIRQEDNDGEFTYSSMVRVDLTGSLAEVVLHPNPVNDILQVVTEEDCTASLVNLSGNTVWTGALCAGDNQLTVDYLPQGLYILVLPNRQIKVQVQR